MNRRTLLWTTLAIVVIGIIIAIVVSRNGGVVNRTSTTVPAISKAQLGGRAPEFRVTPLSPPHSSPHIVFDLDKTSRPVFLELFATWCPHCRRETAVIDRLYEKYRTRLDFIGVSASSVGMDGILPETGQDVANFRSQFHVLYPIAYDGTLNVATQYLQGGYPTLVVISRDKKITYLNSGEVGYPELNAALAALK